MFVGRPILGYGQSFLASSPTPVPGITDKHRHRCEIVIHRNGDGGPDGSLLLKCGNRQTCIFVENKTWRSVFVAKPIALFAPEI